LEGWNILYSDGKNKGPKKFNKSSYSVKANGTETTITPFHFPTPPPRKGGEIKCPVFESCFLSEGPKNTTYIHENARFSFTVLQKG